MHPRSAVFRVALVGNVSRADSFPLSSFSALLTLQSDLLTSRLRSLRPTKKKQQHHTYQTRSAQVRRPGTRSRNSSNRLNSESQMDSDSDGEVGSAFVLCASEHGRQIFAAHVYCQENEAVSPPVTAFYLSVDRQPSRWSKAKPPPMVKLSGRVKAAPGEYL